MKKHRKFVDKTGLTLIELIIAIALLGILAATIIPMAEVTVIRTKELELKRSLRAVRSAIDDYHKDYLKAIEQKKIVEVIGENGFPEELEVLLEGNDWGGLYTIKKKYLRRIPEDPFDKYDDGWGFRAYADEPDSTVWGGNDIYDIYSQSDDIALDGTYYRDW